MRIWLKNNWDKLLFPTLGIIISGVVGFYAGIISINSSISALAQRTTVLETELTSNIKPKIPVVDKVTIDISVMRRDIDMMQRQTDISVQTNKLLDLRLEQERQNTLNQLREFLAKQQK